MDDVVGNFRASWSWRVTCSAFTVSCVDRSASTRTTSRSSTAPTTVGRTQPQRPATACQNAAAAAAEGVRRRVTPPSRCLMAALGTIHTIVVWRRRQPPGYHCASRYLFKYDAAPICSRSSTVMQAYFIRSRIHIYLVRSKLTIATVNKMQ